MCINAYIYIYTHTCIYIHIYMSAHIHTYTYIHAHIQNVHMHPSTPGTTARQRMREELMLMQEALHVSFVRRNQTTFSTSNARTSLYPLPETSIPLNPPSPSSQHTPELFAKMAPCVVVERLEGKQRCSIAAVSEYAGIQARK